MKKSLLLFILLISSVCAFAETKLYIGGGIVSECYSSKQDYKQACGITNKICANVSLDSSYKYIEEKASIILNNTYLHVDNDLKLKWNVFYISSYIDYSTRMFKKEMCKYADICIGLNFNKQVFDWLIVGADFKFGYIPFNTIGDYNNDNNFITALKLNINLKKYVHFYCGVECIETKKESVFFNPLTVKNMIGIKAEYYWNNVGVYGLAEYFCLHPEHSYEYNLTNVNQNRCLISVGVAIKFH